MTVRRVQRAQLTRQDAQVESYSRTLRAIFEDWLQQSVSRGVSTQSLGARLQQAAEASYPAAYLRGKRQASPAATLDPTDRQWLQRALVQNRTYIQHSLEADILDKATLQRMQGSDVQGLSKSFASRVEQQYGGQLWRVTEAGFRAGVGDLATRLRLRFGRVPIVQEGDQQDDEVALIALAAALGLAVGVLRRQLERAGATVTDLAISEDPATQAVAQAAGVTPEALATAATEAASGTTPTPLSEATPATQDEALALGLGLSVGELRALGDSVLSGGLRLGTGYRAYGDACRPCSIDAESGDGQGNYWEPDQPPLPGDDCVGRGNCRCWLESVFEVPGQLI